MDEEETEKVLGVAELRRFARLDLSRLADDLRFSQSTWGEAKDERNRHLTGP
jgi:hypothetical protein